MTLSAARKTVEFRNEVFKLQAKVLARKIVIFGRFDPGKTGVIPNVRKRVFSAEQVGSEAGFGFEIHRLALQTLAGSQGVEMWIVPQDEAGGAVAALGDIDFVGTTGVKSGVMNFYGAALHVPVALINDETPQQVAIKLVAAINADKNLPFTAVVNGVTDTQVDFTAKTKGEYGNDISLAFDIRAGDAPVEGIIAAITPMATGSGIPDIQDALDALGIGDNQNEEFFTDLVTGYRDTGSQDKISAYNGNMQTATGNYKGGIERPFRHLVGDVTPDVAGLSALIAIADLRTETDMTNGVIPEPGNLHHPTEIAAVAMGVMARINNIRAEEGYVDKVLPGIIPSPAATRWTDDPDNRTTAVNNGVGTTMVKNNAVVLQDVLTYFRPENLPEDSNAHRRQRNISLTQNIYADTGLTFKLDKWNGWTVVRDTARVTNSASQIKARDTGDVLDDLMERTLEYEKNAWIYEAAFTISELKKGDKVTVRADGSGFDWTLPLIYSGEGTVLNGLVSIDVSFAITL